VNTLQVIAGSANHLATAADEHPSATAEQRDRAGAATAVNEMTTAVEAVVRNAVSTSDATRQSSQSAHLGQERVSEAASAISALVSDVQHTGEYP
jgi:methyl-accepting chemotaxis protein